MGDQERPPWWASLGFWLFMAVFAATMAFSWHNRVFLLRVCRTYLPAVKAAGQGVYREVRSMQGEAVVEEGADEEPGPSAASLSAPVDPSRDFNKIPRGARVRSSSEGRRLMRDVRGRGRKSAAEVQEARQRMGAPDVGGEDELGFWRTDLGLGILMSLGISFCFFVAGMILFRNRDMSARKMT